MENATFLVGAKDDAKNEPELFDHACCALRQAFNKILSVLPENRGDRKKEGKMLGKNMW